MWKYNNTNLELCHYGVLGMKWGKRKASGSKKSSSYKINKKYSNANRAIDKTVYGNKGVERISKRMDKGMSYKTASRKEFGRQLTTAALLTVGSYGAAFAYTFGAKNTGRLAVSAALSAMGHRNIQWID